MDDHSTTTLWHPAPRRRRHCGVWPAIATISAPLPNAASPTPTTPGAPPSPPPPAPISSDALAESNLNHYTQDSRPIDPVSISPSKDQDDLIGTLLNERYEITSHIASGGQARVYLARDTLFRRDVAIKVFCNKEDDETKKQEALDRTCERGFWHVELLAQIKSPHVVETLDVIKIGDRAYHHVMEYIDGESLANYLSREGPISWRRAAEIGVQLCDALIALHEHNPSGRRVCAVHRDIKPDNVIRLKSSDSFADHIKLVDLGAAKRVPRVTCQVHMPSTEGPVDEELPLTWAYCAPEQDFLARGHGYDLPTTAGIHTDVFQVAEVLYELVTGATPFPYNSPTKLSEARQRLYVEGTVRPPSTIAPQGSIPPLFDCILLTALEKWPENRFPDARAFRAALQDLLRRTNTTLPFEAWPLRLHFLTLIILACASGFGGSHLVQEIRRDTAAAELAAEHASSKAASPAQAAPPPSTPPVPTSATNTTTDVAPSETPSAEEMTGTSQLIALPAPPKAPGDTPPDPPPLSPAPTPKERLRQAAKDALHTCRAHLVADQTWTIHASHSSSGWLFAQDWTMDSRYAGQCVRTELEKWGAKNPVAGKSDAFDLTLAIASGRRTVAVRRPKK